MQHDAVDADSVKALSSSGFVPHRKAARLLRRYHDAVVVDVYRIRLYPVQQGTATRGQICRT